VAKNKVILVIQSHCVNLGDLLDQLSEIEIAQYWPTFEAKNIDINMKFLDLAGVIDQKRFPWCGK
jgi:hypothetical protein